MMKLSTMCKVDCMVGANGESPVAEQLLKDWEHDPGSVRFFRSSANFVYVLRNGGRECFLRFAESSERTRETIEAEMDILHWVADKGMAVALPMQSRNGNVVETIVTDLGTFTPSCSLAWKAPGWRLEISMTSNFGSVERPWGSCTQPYGPMQALAYLHGARGGIIWS